MTLAPAAPPTDAPEATAAPARRRRLLVAIDLVCIVVPTLLLARALAPATWLSDSELWRGDGAGHVAAIWTLAHEVLPRWSLTGWSDDMFAGYPVNGLYPPLGAVLAALLSFALPLVVAYKLVVVVPVVLLPLATWAATRWSGLPRGFAPMAAVLVLPFAFDTACAGCGGTVASASLGEYAYAWGLVLAVLASGLVVRLCRTGHGAALAAVALAAAGLAHPLTAAWCAVLVVAAVLLQRPWRDPRLVLRVPLVLATSLLLAAWWWIPFADGRAYAPTQGARGQSDLLAALFPSSWWVDLLGFALACAGVAAAWFLRSAWLGALAATTGLVVLLFLLLPDDGAFPRERVVPLWSYGRWMLAAAGLMWLLGLAGERVRRAEVWAPVAVLGVVTVVVATTWGMVGVVRPAVVDGGDGAGRLLGIDYAVDELSAFPAASFGGYAERPDRADFEDMRAVLASTADLGVCGRLAWDLGTADSPTGGPFSDETAPWRANVWTGGCLRPLTGVLLDSSGVSPAAWATQNLMSNGGIRMLPWVSDEQFDAEKAIARLQTMGVRWVLTHGGPAEQALVATEQLVPGPSQGRWHVWGVVNAPIAQGLSYYPVVIGRALSTPELYRLDDTYRRASSYLAVPLVTEGEASWPTTDLASAPAVAKLPSVSFVNDLTDADLSADPDRFGFAVTQPGFPVLVKVSDYPGWSVEGARGPYRTSGNFMVVVPTSTTVIFTRTRTPAEWTGLAAGVLGLAGLAALAWLGVRDRRRED